MPLLSWVNTMMILSSVATTLLLLRNNWILFHQSSNFLLLLSNHLGSGTMFFSMTVSSYTAGLGAVDISSNNTGSVVLFLSEMYSSVILNDPYLF